MAGKNLRKKSRQEVGNLRFGIFNSFIIEDSGILVMLHFLRLPLDVNSL
jgi:hypothetical protein